MHKVSHLHSLVAAALIGIAVGNAWSEEATPAEPAAPAGEAAAPVTGAVPGRYPPPPERRGYPQPGTQPSQWPAPPPAYSQPGPYTPPYGQYRAGPGTPAENPLSATLKQTQEQLATKTAELDAIRKQRARLQADLEVAMAALQKAQADTVNAGQQVDTSMAQVDTLKHILCELAARLEARNTTLQNTLQTPAAEPDDPDSAAAGEVETETADQAGPQTDRKCSRLSQYPAITSGQRGITVTPQAR